MSDMKPRIIVTELPEGYLRKRMLSYDGAVISDETILPHDDLLRLMAWPANEYCERLGLLQEHPVFDEETLDGVLREVDNFMVQAVELLDSLQEDYPEGHLFLRRAIEEALLVKDKRVAERLQRTADRIYWAAQEPYLTRVQLRNVLEICFGATEGMTQEERWECAMQTYPQLQRYDFATRWRMDDGAWVQEYVMDSTFDLFLFELFALLRSSKRLVRCQCCWQYFVPKTKKKTVYCDRAVKGAQTCKDLGPNLKRYDGPAEDYYLMAFKRLNARFYERSYSHYFVEESSVVHYDWIETASAARRDYLNGKISGEEFLRIINPDGEDLNLGDFKVEEPPEDKRFTIIPWHELVKHDLSFDPKRHFVDMQVIDLGAENPEWEIISADDQLREAIHGNESLLSKYRKD